MQAGRAGKAPCIPALARSRASPLCWPKLTSRHARPLAAASANATKKSFELELLKPGGAGAPAAEAAVVAANGAPDGGAAPANATGGKAGLKANDFPFLGMPKDQDWIL